MTFVYHMKLLNLNQQVSVFEMCQRSYLRAYMSFSQVLENTANLTMYKVLMFSSAFSAVMVIVISFVWSTEHTFLGFYFVYYNQYL